MKAIAEFRMMYESNTFISSSIQCNNNILLADTIYTEELVLELKCALNCMSVDAVIALLGEPRLRVFQLFVRAQHQSDQTADN